MSISVDCSEIIAQVIQRCRLECRQPTGEEYEIIISCLQQANGQLQQTIMQLQQDRNELACKNEILDSKCALSVQDSQKSLELLRHKHLEVIQQGEEIAKLTTMVSGLEEEASDSAKNLEDVIKTNDALLLENDKLKKQAERALNEKDKDKLSKEAKSALDEKDKQISALLEEHNRLVNKNKENEEIIALLIKENQQCQCKPKSKSEVMRDSSPKDSSSPDAEQNLALHQSLNSLPITRQLNEHSSLSNDVGIAKCIHIDNEQKAMIEKIIHTTSKATLRCKASTGNKRCNSTHNINMCLKCNVTCCLRHLYECHSKEHTVFMKMATKTIWCYSCECDPLSSDAHDVTSLHKDKSYKKHEKSKPVQQPYNYRGEISRRSPDHYSSHRRSKSASQFSSKTIPPAARQPPLYYPSVDYDLPVTTSSIHASTLSSTRTTTERQALTSADIKSSATVTLSDSISNSHTSYLASTGNHMLSINAPASSSGHSITSTVTSDSLPSLSKPSVATVDSPATTATNVPRICGKQTATTGTNMSDIKLPLRNAADNLKSDIMQDPINRANFKCVTSTNITTGIVPVTSKSYSGTLHINSWAHPLPSPTSKSETAGHNGTSTKSIPSIDESSLHARFSHRSISASVDHETGKSQPVTQTSRERSWSLENLYGLNGFDPPPFKGLVNAGLTCFFNSAIQGLSRIDQFNELLTKLFKPGDHVQMDLKKLDSSLQVAIPPGGHGEVSKHLSKTIADVRKPAVSRYDTYFNPSRLFSSIQAKYKNSFRPYRQGDAHEVMRCILDAIRMEEIEKVKRGIKLTYTGSEHGDVEALQNGEEKMLCKAALRSAHKIRTYIDQVIGGELLSVVVCEHCKHRAELIEPFLDVSLPIPDKRSAADSSYYTSHYHWMTSCAQNPTLEECFKEYTSEDTLDNDNKFICSKCSGTGDKIELRRAMKQLKLLTLPQVFIIHLKRFSIDHIVTKNSIQVKYPAIIDVREYCTEQSLSDNRQSTKYSLFAVIQHIGTLNFGHYTAYIKMDDTKKWYKADDSSVTEVDKKEALRQEAYLLFYQQM